MNNYRYSAHRYDSGMGENYLALEGLEQELPIIVAAQDEPSTTLWDDYFDEDIAALVHSSGAYQ